MWFLARLIRFLWKTIVWLLAILIAIPILGLAYGMATTGGTKGVPANATPAFEPAIREALTGDSAKLLRPEDNTILTYPEWGIVYAARDYAAFVRQNGEAGFPYLRYTGLYWQDYARALRATREYRFNTEYNVMLAVIGTSQTVEYLLQGAWENTIGRLTEFIADGRVGEDDIRTSLALDYARMLDQVPWYEFPYAQARALTWHLPPETGPAAVRSWERKIAFGFSDTVKSAYAKAVKASLAASGGPDETEIAVWAKGPVTEAIVNESGTRLLGEFGDKGTLFAAKRYQAFTDLAPRLAERGVTFIEIGGNDLILVTVLGTKAIEHSAGGVEAHFSHEIPARPGTWRTGLLVPVDKLHEFFGPLADAGYELEHVYDY